MIKLRNLRSISISPICPYVLQELNMKQVHKKKEHETLLSQHDSTQSLEYKHLNTIQEQRMEHLRSTRLLCNSVEFIQYFSGLFTPMCVWSNYLGYFRSDLYQTWYECLQIGIRPIICGLS